MQGKTHADRADPCPSPKGILQDDHQTVLNAVACHAEVEDELLTGFPPLIRIGTASTPPPAHGSEMTRNAGRGGHDQLPILLELDALYPWAF